MDVQPASKKNWLRAGLSALIIYHLMAIMLAPNAENHLGMKLGPLLNPYIFGLEFTNGWSFFAPNPEPPIFIEYELLGAKGERLHYGRWPEETKDSFFLRERQNRRVSSTDFMISAEIRTEKIMVPYLCSRELAARSLRLWRVMHTLPSMAEVESGKRKLGDDVGVEKRFVSHSFCEQKLSASAEKGAKDGET